MTYSDCFYHFIPGVLYYVIYSYHFILPEVIAVYFNFNTDNCHARILRTVTYSTSVGILLEDKNKLQLHSSLNNVVMFDGTATICFNFPFLFPHTEL